jgi:hypothetical protein
MREDERGKKARGVGGGFIGDIAVVGDWPWAAPRSVNQC